MRAAASRDPRAWSRDAAARRAEPVDRLRGDIRSEVCEQRDQPRDVEALLAFGHRAAEDDVVDLGLRLWDAPHQAADDIGGELVGTLRGERALVTAADRAAN